VQPARDRENLAGLVERVTFHNKDSGFWCCASRRGVSAI
jgi:hypothetical protein